jgi:hypothetical protein
MGKLSLSGHRKAVTIVVSALGNSQVAETDPRRIQTDAPYERDSEVCEHSASAARCKIAERFERSFLGREGELVQNSSHRPRFSGL